MFDRLCAPIRLESNSMRPVGVLKVAFVRRGPELDARRGDVDGERPVRRETRTGERSRRAREIVAERVVHVDDRVAGSELEKQLGLGRAVRLHVAVKIEVVLRQVGERRRPKSEPPSTRSCASACDETSITRCEAPRVLHRASDAHDLVRLGRRVRCLDDRSSNR